MKRYGRTYREKGKIKGIADVKEKPSHLRWELINIHFYQSFRVFLLFFVDYLKAAVANIVLARRVCAILCQKLKIIADLHEYEYTEDSFMQEHPPTPPMNYMIPAPLKRDRLGEIMEDETEKDKENEKEQNKENGEAEKDKDDKTPPAQDQDMAEPEADKEMEVEPEQEEYANLQRKFSILFSRLPPLPENTLPLNILHALAQCKAYRKNLHLLSSMVQYIVVEAPYALIWSGNVIVRILIQIYLSSLYFSVRSIDRFPL